MHIFIFRYNIYYEELAHVIMEAEKVHDLPYAHGDSWRLVAQFPSTSEGLRTRCAGVWVPVSGQETRVSSQTVGQSGDRILSSSILLFYSSPQLIR